VNLSRVDGNSSGRAIPTIDATLAPISFAVLDLLHIDKTFYSGKGYCPGSKRKNE
jgi:hypothetical protein